MGLRVTCRYQAQIILYMNELAAIIHLVDIMLHLVTSSYIAGERLNLGQP